MKRGARMMLSLERVVRVEKGEPEGFSGGKQPT